MRCGVCGSQSMRAIFKIGKWDIIECSHCLVQFISPKPSDDEISAMYREYYESGEGARQLANPSYGRLSFPRQWGIISSLARKREGRLLDFGCGGGHFLARVSDRWQRYGIEISEKASDVAAQKHFAVYSRLECMRTWGEFFDVITMFATIEHLPNPREVVGELAKLLKPDGLFVIMTGDVKSTKAAWQGQKWSMYAPPGHIYYFAAYSVDYLMQSLGFRKVKHLYTDGGMTSIPFMPLNLALRAGLEICFRMPKLNELSLFDTYYGYYRKESVR